MKTMKDYHDFYLKCDILLLGNVFEKFRDKSLINYHHHYIYHYHY